MMTALPRRPYVEQSPPDGGLDQVRVAARGRRRRRSAAAALGGAVTAGVTAVAVVLVTSGASQDTLRPLPPAIQPSPHVSPGPVVHHARGHHHAATTDGKGGRKPPRHGNVSASGPLVIDNGPVVVKQPASGDVPTAEPVTLRVFRSHLAAADPTICTGDTSGSGTNVGGGVGWCLTATAARVTGGEALTVTACRGASGGGTLTYSTTREVDLAVEQGGRKVWDWATDHPATPSAHTRSAAANECWNWQLVWPDITQSGAPAGRGNFTFVGTTTAQELAGYPPRTADFQY